MASPKPVDQTVRPPRLKGRQMAVYCAKSAHDSLSFHVITSTVALAFLVFVLVRTI